MGTKWLVCALAVPGLTGCDSLFSLTHLPVRSSEAFIRDGDADLDGTANDTDLCPLVADDQIGASTDQDEDGVGDACDPNPTKAGDCLLLFDDFPEFGPPWMADGARPDIGSDQYYPHYLRFERGPEEIVWLDRNLDLDAVEVEAYVQAGDNGDSPDRYAIALYNDLQRSPTGQPSGEACATQSDSVSSELVALTTTAGMDQVGASVATGAALIGPPSDVWLHWGPAAGGTACQGGPDPDSWTTPPSVLAPMPKGRTFALRGIEVGLFVRYVIGWGQCR